MRRTRTRTIVIALLGFLLAAAGTGWAHHIVMHSGPFQAIIVTIAVHPTDGTLLYLGTFGRGIFRSKDGGEVWVSSNEGLENLQVQSLAIDPVTPSHLYAGTDAGVFKSTNGGARWELAGQAIAKRSVRTVAVARSTPPTLYVGTDAGVFQSEDGGRSWHERTGGLTSRDVRAVVVDPENPRIIYAATFGGVFMSVDGGIHWTASSNGLGNANIRTLILDQHEPSTLYAGAATQGVFKSLDGGASWRSVTDEMGEVRVLTLAMHPSRSTIFAGTTAGLLRNHRGASAWQQVEPDSLSLSITAVATDLRSPQTIYVATGGLFFKSLDGGRNWSGVKWVIHPDLPFEQVGDK